MGSNIIDSLLEKGYDGAEIHNFCKEKDILNIEYMMYYTSEKAKESHLKRIKDAQIEVDFMNYKKNNQNGKV